jgi:type II secretory pathway component PulC
MLSNGARHALVRALGGEQRPLSKRSKGSRSVRGVTVATLVLGVTAGAVALIVRGTLDLRRLATAGAGATSPRSEGSVAAAEAASPVQIGELILSRNIFDSLSGSLAWELADAAAQDAAASPGVDAGPLVVGGRCSGDLRLLGSVVHTRDPRRSIAALRVDGKSSLMTVGERLGELELVELHPTEAFFRRGGRELCSLPVYLADNDAPPTQIAEPPPPPKAEAKTGEFTPANPNRPPAFSEEELKQNIRVLSATRFAVTRELFTRARMNPASVTRGARFKSQERDDRAIGLQVFRLRADSLLANLGVKQGDILRGINGHSLTSADGVLEAFGHLGKSPELSLVVERNGTRTTIEYVLE